MLLLSRWVRQDFTSVCSNRSPHRICSAPSKRRNGVLTLGWQHCSLLSCIKCYFLLSSCFCQILFFEENLQQYKLEVLETASRCLKQNIFTILVFKLSAVCFYKYILAVFFLKWALWIQFLDIPWLTGRKTHYFFFLLILITMKKCMQASWSRQDSGYKK